MRHRDGDGVYGVDVVVMVCYYETYCCLVVLGGSSVSS